MNKIIEQSQQLQTVRICYGNDFSLSLTVCTWNADTSAWDKVDLSAAQDVEMFLVAQNGKRIKTTTTVDENSNVIANIPSTYLSKTLYAIEITFKLDNRNRRTYSPGLIQIVNDTDEAGFSTQDYITNDAYHFDIKVTNDVAWLNIGHLPSEYVTEDELANTLESYVTQDNLQDELEPYINEDELGTTLENYVTNSSLSTTLDDYATKQYVDDGLANIDLTDYYTKSEVDTTLNSYGTSLYSLMGVNATSNIKSQHIQLKNSSNNRLSDIAINAFHKNDTQSGWEITPRNEIGLIELSTVETIYNTVDSVNNILSDYITSTSLNSTLSDYATKSFLATVLNDYVTNTSLNSTLNDYATKSFLATVLNDYVTNTSLNSTLNDYATKSFLATTLNDYATISSLSDYVTNSSLSTILGDYVTNSILSSTLANYASASDVDALDNRVTALENNPSVPSNVVTSDDGNEIVCLTQSEYDTLEQNQQLDDGTFYYITDATSEYVTNSELQDAISGINIPTATSDLTNDSGFIVAGDDISLLNNDAGFITLNDIPQSSGVSEEDWDNANEAIAQELLDNRLEHQTINSNFSNYYTKTESDGRYASTSWANSRFVTQADDTNRQQAIAAAFASSVQSTSVHNIWTGSQNDYDAITTKDTNTLYIIL